MSQTFINNNDPGLDVRNTLNFMFTEIYASIIVPIKIPGVNLNTVQTIPFNTWLNQIIVATTAGGPTLRIGTTANGTELCDDTLVGAYFRIPAGLYFPNNQDIYFTISGGVINVRIDVIPNYF